MRKNIILSFALLLPLLTPALALDWLTPLIHEKDNGIVALPAPAAGTLRTLRFGSHAYAPDASPPRIGTQLVAPFQQLYIDTVPFAGAAAKRAITRDAFWDQIILADPAAVAAATPLPQYTFVEIGDFASALPPRVRAINLSDAEVAAQRDRLDDPVIPQKPAREIPWAELEAAAYPLDFQKVLLASPGDLNPGFAFQNGQWLTTWLSRDLPKWTKEDHWFAPAILLDGVIMRPAPLSARTAFVRNADGVTLPAWTLEWRHDESGAIVRQQLFSHRPSGQKDASVFVRFELVNLPEGAQLVIGAGRRPNVHYWDEQKHPRTPAPFFSLEPRYTQNGALVLDAWDNVILASAQPFRMEPLGPLEVLLVFEPAGVVCLQTPQAETSGFEATPHIAAEREFTRFWTRALTAGAGVRVPDAAWMERIDIWRSQVETITRVHYQNKERLSYGTYFYQYYFGIEEAWPVVANALWGRHSEAKRQAEIMLDPENLDKTNVHHQSRNGAAPLAAAIAARLSCDRDWLTRIAPALIECARWTGRARNENPDARPPLLRGLLPPHIYGGDVRDPATSLYATAACWCGLEETASIFRDLGAPPLAEEGRKLAEQADALRARLAAVFREVTLADGAQPPFVPFALGLPSLDGKNEGPYDQLTRTRYGNYWNLFAPSFLELDFRDHAEPGFPNTHVFDYAASHGGLWAGLPRFYEGLDAAYSTGFIGWLLEQSTRDGSFRHQALASLQSFMLHGSSRNGHTIPEVAGLFPYRLQAAAYEQIVREAPWHFGMHDAHRYLEGHASFTEPLGSVAGAALTLVRNFLLVETRAPSGDPDGGIMLFAAVPSAWFAEGQEIELRDMPTYYGTLGATVRSCVASAREIELEYAFAPNGIKPPRPVKITARFAPPGEAVKEITFEPQARGTITIKF